VSLLAGEAGVEGGGVDQEVEKLAVLKLTVAVEVSVLEASLVDRSVAVDEFAVAVEESRTVFALVRPPLAKADGTVASLPARHTFFFLHKTLSGFLRTFLSRFLDSEVLAMQI
jgi:hypothetical protein